MFSGCQALRELALPEGLAFIGNGAVDTRYIRRLPGLISLLLGRRCMVTPLFLSGLLSARWLGADDSVVAAVYLRSGRRAVETQAANALAADPTWAVEVFADLLERYPTARFVHKAAVFVENCAPALWPETYARFYAMARAAGRKKGLRRLDAIQRQLAARISPSDKRPVGTSPQTVV